MAQYDYYPSPAGLGFVVDVQSNLLRSFVTRTVAPLVPVDELRARNQYLNPTIAIGDAAFVLLPNFTQTLLLSSLGRSLGSLVHEEPRISRAYDYLLHGN